MGGPIGVGTVGATVTVGGSGWGAQAHVPALRSLPEFRLRAVCTNHADTAQASAEAFGAERAFDDFDAMLADPEVDLVTVVVRVPGHHGLVMRALGAGKHVYCEWPLGATVAEAEEMAALAEERAVHTAVGLQARSDPTLRYARELVQQGYIGEVLGVRYSSVGQTISERGTGRVWQGIRKNGANTLTIAAGHAIDALCFVAGEFREVAARLATHTTEWTNTDTGETLRVDSPDWISVAGGLENGAEAAFLVSTVPLPSQPGGTRFDVYGRDGALTITSRSSLNSGPNQLQAIRKGQAPGALDTPARFSLVPQATPAGAPRNVAQAYVRLAEAIDGGQPFEPGFSHAVRRHALIAAIERSAAEGRTVSPA